VPVGGAAAVAVGLVEVPAPAGRHERRRLLSGGLLRDGRSAGRVQFPQHLDRGQQRVDVRVGGVAGQWQVPDDGRGEGAQVLVTGGKQVEMAVITRIPLGHWAARGLQARHPDARTDQPPGVRVGHERIGDNVEYLVQQPSAGDLDTCSFHDPLRQLVPGARIGPGQRLIQELHELVEDLDVGLGQRRQQDGISPVAIGALQRLVGRTATGLGQHPASTSRQRGQVKPIGAMSEVVPGLVEVEVAVPRLMPALR